MYKTILGHLGFTYIYRIVSDSKFKDKHEERTYLKSKAMLR